MRKQKAGDTVDPGRRGFLRGKFFTREGRNEVRQQGRLLGPLPPALPAQLVAQNPCEDCDQPCVHACEPAIIYLHPPGHRFRGMPYLSFQSGSCTFCRGCVDVCPLEHDDQVPARLGTARLDREKCMAWNGVICLSCQTACGFQAVSMDPRSRPAIKTEACTGCGACVGVCPSSAIAVPAATVELSDNA